MKYLVYLLVGLSVFSIACNECTSCEPFTEEPFVLVRFYNAADTSQRTVVIDSVNQVPAAGLRHFNDTTWEFKFPLNMHDDVSGFDLVVREADHLDSISYNHFVRFNYLRQFVRRDDNYIVVECDLVSMESNFKDASLVCKEEDICKSNDAKASLYY